MTKIIRIPTFVLLTVFYLGQTLAQNAENNNLDSLINVAETDTGRINLILKKLDKLGAINLDSAIDLGLKTLSEVQKIDFYKGEVTVRQKLVYNYAYKGNFKEATEQLKDFEKFISSSKDSTDFATVYASWGLLYGMQSKYDTSITYYEKAIRINEKLGKRQHLSAFYSNIGIGYQQQSNFPMALKYQQKSLRLCEEDKNESGQAYTYVNMANTYENMGDLNRAENSFLKSIELAKKTQQNNVVLYAYSNLSSLYSDEKEWQKSYEFALKAADLGDKIGDKGISAASFSKASRALVELKKPEEAITFAQKAIALADSSEQPLVINQAYSSMGYALNSQKRFKKAIPFYEKALKSIKDADLYTSSNGILFQQLSECYEKTGGYPKALEFYKQYTMINDSVRSKENVQKATELTMNYEFEKKEQSAKAIQDAKDEIMRTRQLALIIGLLLSSILILGALIGYFSKKKAYALLDEQKNELENTLSKLKSTQSQLIHAEKMASLGELTAGIAHEIKNPLNFVNNFSEVSSDLITEMIEEVEKGNATEVKVIAEDLKQNIEKINHHGKRADSIVKGMLLHSRGTSGEKTLTDVNELLDQYVTLAYHGLRAQDKEFNIALVKDYDKSLEKINVVPQDISRVFLNILNNACYAAYNKKKKNDIDFSPTLKVSTKNHNDKIEIHIHDNGNGIPKKIFDKIFQPFYTTKPTGEGTGLGLSLSYDIIVKEHSGEIKFESEEGEYTEFIITLPKQK